ncbi:MAG: hypothetical protein JW775_07485 [Candidatus Aminicenantes bacterium]|nr:hypothetical protein [Candidatus Aminicenantes bacterium]
MKIRTKLAIVVVAVVLSLVGYGVVADALSVEHVMAGATPTTEVTVEVTG